MTENKYDEEDRWLLSDSQILGRTHRAPNKKGTELTLQMPDGEPLVAVVEKISAASMTEWCTIAREVYDERKSEQKAKKLQSAVSDSTGADAGADAKSIPTLETNVGQLSINAEAISGRLDQIRDWFNSTSEIGEQLRVEQRQLEQILEVLNAPQDNRTELSGVSNQEAKRPQGGDVMGAEARAQEVHGAGTEDISSEGKGLDFPAPDTDAESSSVDHDD